MSTTAQTRAVAQAWFDALTSGRIGDAIALLDPQVEWINYKVIPGYNDEMPWIGTVRGPQDVLRTFRAFISVATPQTEELVRLIVDGHEAMGVVHEVSIVNDTGHTFEIEFIQELTVRDGKIARWKSYTDPSSIEQAIEWNAGARLLAATRAGDIATMQALLRRRVNPDARDPDTGLTLLMVAAGRGHVEAVDLLLAHGADVLTIDPKGGASALHKAVQSGSVACVQALLAAGAFVDWQACTTGHTPLMDAFWFKYPDIVVCLLEHQAGLNLGTHYGFTFRQHVEYERTVNVHGKERIEEATRLVKVRDQADRALVASQSLMQAVVDGDVAAVAAQLGAGAPVDARSPVVNGFNDLHTPLLVACRDGHTDIVRLLLVAGADVNTVEPTFGAVPLHKATYNGHADIVALLVQQPGIDLDWQGATNGYTPLHDALWHGYEDCARILIDAGARVDLEGHDGKRPLDVALDSFDAKAPIVRVLDSAAAA